MTPTAPLRTIGLTSDYYFSTFRNWAWLNWSKSSACFVVLWIVSGTFLSLPLTETWGKLGHEEETFSCTITSSDGKQRSTKNPLFFLMILGKYCSFTYLHFKHSSVSSYFVFDNYLGIIVPLIIIIVSLVGLLMKVKKLRSSASIMKKNPELRKAQQGMESKVNNRIGMVCGTFIVLQLPAYLVGIIVVTKS